MKLKITSIRDKGSYEKERVIIHAVDDELIGAYLLTSSLRSEDGVFWLGNGLWFSNDQVKKDDIIVVYSKKGEKKVKKNISGRTSYFFYLELDSPCWDSGAIAGLMKIQDAEGYAPSLEDAATLEEE